MFPKFFLIPFLFLSVSVITPLYAQEEEEQATTTDCPDPDNDKAVKLFKKSQDKKKYEYKERVAFVKEALQEEADYAQANLEFARQIILVSKNRDQSFAAAEPFLLKVIEQCPKLHSDPYYYLGIINWENKKYNECIKYMQQYIDFKEENEKKYHKDYSSFLVDAKKLIRLSRFYDDIYNNPKPFDPKIVEGLSSDMSEYLPIITPDNEMALYTRQRKPISKSPIQSDRMVESFMVSKKRNGKFDNGMSMSPPFNQGTNEGGATLTIDNRHMYFTICKDEGGSQPNCDIWTSDMVNGKWTELRRLPNVNDSERWDSQPSVSSDGKTIYFASDRSGGLGGIDIWKTEKTANGWGAPVNMGTTINTGGDEKSPFIHSDSQTLYFSSGPSASGEGGLPGVGGMDIFYSRGDEQGRWGEPRNIGTPINTKGDDVGFFVSTDGLTGYFASDDQRKTKGRTLGGLDIYSFELYKEARPEKVVFIEGTLTDDKGAAITDAKVIIKDASSKRVSEAVVDSASGNYRAIVADKGHDLVVQIEKKGMAFSSQLVATKDSLAGKRLKVNIESKQIEVNKPYVLNNIYYSTGHSDLIGPSKAVIEDFANFLKSNPNLKIEIHGHTDNQGNDKDNMALSKDRAFSVYETLSGLGITKDQITDFKGFGSSKPIAANDTEQGRAKNRRTEFWVVAK